VSLPLKSSWSAFPDARAIPAWLLAGLAVATLLAALAALGWPFELFAHFSAQYLAAALLLALLLGAQRRARLALLAILMAGWHALPGIAVLRAAPAAPGSDGPSRTVATANVRFTNTSREPFLAWLRSSPADLVVVQEVTAGWAAALEAIPGYPHRHALTREDPYGIAVYSRWPLHAVEAVDLAADGLPSLAGELEVGGRRVRFLGLHTHWPVTPDLARARDAALHQAAVLARDGAGPVVLLGDLNLTPDAPAFPRLLAEGNLRDVMDGRRWRPTWRAGFWPLALRIDHVLVSPALCVEQAEVGPSVGSDHRPVIARLRLPAAPGADAAGR
jgi:endonuclease/exonuclease/phosphatase (EEP) superfamily protein YafD